MHTQDEIMSQMQGITGLYISKNGTKYYARRNGDKMIVRFGKQSKTMSVIEFVKGLT